MKRIILAHTSSVGIESELYMVSQYDENTATKEEGLFEE